MKRAINIRPSRTLALVSGLLPFIVVAVFYVSASITRHADNENDRLLPGITQLYEGIHQIALEEDKRTGNIILWTDTVASLKRLAWGVGISATSGLLFGMLTGMFPLFRNTFSPPIAVLSLIPPMAILPILFVMCGLGEVSKVVLIVLGIAPVIIRDMQGRVQDLPHEQLIKAQSLGASSWQIAVRVVLPQVLPRLLDALRLSLGAAWLFLISAEAIAAEDGLGYRIFLLRRYLAMDVILPYVAWITLLAWLMDRGLRQLHQKAFPWIQGKDTGEDAP
ncbi:MAG TPA: ABC transporter permease subunit [Pseudomonadales bacterium]|nr:ABC transporter permease subunit [Pseudomonadales bacterium]